MTHPIQAIPGTRLLQKYYTMEVLYNDNTLVCLPTTACVTRGKRPIYVMGNDRVSDSSFNGKRGAAGRIIGLERDPAEVVAMLLHYRGEAIPCHFIWLDNDEERYTWVGSPKPLQSKAEELRGDS